IEMNWIPNDLSAGAWSNDGTNGWSSAGAISTPYSATWFSEIGPGTWAIEFANTTAPTNGIVTFEYSIDGGSNWVTLAANVDMYTAGFATKITAATGI